MKVLCGGGTGFVGNALVRRLQQLGHDVIVISRARGANRVTWDDIRQKGLFDADAVVNLSGAKILNFLRPWTSSFKKEVISSRVDTTKLLARSIQESKKRPSVFVCTSAVGIYPPSRTTVYNEKATVVPVDFASQLCYDIEAAAEVHDNVRAVAVRMGVVLGKGGGAFASMKLPFSLGLGGTFGDGSQYFPWIHLEDAVGIYVHAIENPEVAGPLNAVSPHVTTNKELVKTLASAMHRPAFLPVPGFLLKLLLHPERAKMLLEGQMVIPKRTLELGYKFRFDTLEKACQDLVRKR